MTGDKPHDAARAECPECHGETSHGMVRDFGRCGICVMQAARERKAGRSA